MRTVACDTFEMVLALYGGHVNKLYIDLILKAKLLNCNQILGLVTDQNYVAYITVRKRSCGKVMFLHLSVSQSVHGGCLPQCMLGNTTPCPVHAGIYNPCPVHAGIDMATAADGTHPTEMHSC